MRDVRKKTGRLREAKAFNVDFQDRLRSDCIDELGLTPPPCVANGASIAEAVALMQRQKSGCVLVIDCDAGTETPGTVLPDSASSGSVCCGPSDGTLIAGRLLGIFTERDLLKRVLFANVSTDSAVSSVMTSSPETVLPDDSIATVIAKMNDGGFRHIPVVGASDSVVGVVSVKQVVQYLVEHFPEAVYNLPPDPAKVGASREGS